MDPSAYFADQDSAYEARHLPHLEAYMARRTGHTPTLPVGRLSLPTNSITKTCKCGRRFEVEAGRGHNRRVYCPECQKAIRESRGLAL